MAVCFNVRINDEFEVCLPLTGEVVKVERHNYTVLLDYIDT